MHEELVKVTNELYTVSTTDRPFTLCLAATRLQGVSRFWRVSPVEPSVHLDDESELSHPENMRITGVSAENLTHVSTPLKNRPSNATWALRIPTFTVDFACKELKRRRHVHVSF